MPKSINNTVLTPTVMESIKPGSQHEALLFKILDPTLSPKERKARQTGLAVLGVTASVLTFGAGIVPFHKLYKSYSAYKQRIDYIVKDAAAIKIQALFRGYLVRTAFRFGSKSGTPVHPEKRSLYVREVTDKEELVELSKIALSWADTALSKQDFSELTNHLEHNARRMADHLKDPGSNPLWNRAFICKDLVLDRIQAIALVDDTDTRILEPIYLITNPDNERSKENLSILTRVEGAGTKLILHLAKEAFQNDKSIHLKSVPNAYPFYKKIGFTVSPSPNANQLIPMRLSKAKMQALIA